jgi:Terminase large subunit, T4likevirus-type, N-terminal
MDATTMLALKLDPSLMMDLLGFEPLPWQRQMLRSTSDKILLNCHRQAGKSVSVGALAVWTALAEPGALIVIASASQRQAGELFRKVSEYYRKLGSPAGKAEDNSTTLTMETGSRVVSLPDSPDTIVGFSGPRLVILDEGSRVSDETFVAVRPMLTASRGRMVAMSTPRGRRGWFYSQWTDSNAAWERIQFRAADNPRVDRAWLEEERAILGPRWFEQEYGCQFLESDDAVFSVDAIEAAFTDDVQPLFS